MRRRAFITLLGAAAAWPLAARGQHTSVRHIGVLMTGFANGETARFLLDPLRDGLRELGWIEGQNISLDYRFGHGQADLLPAVLTRRPCSGECPSVVGVRICDYTYRQFSIF